MLEIKRPKQNREKELEYLLTTIASFSMKASGKMDLSMVKEFLGWKMELTMM